MTGEGRVQPPERHTHTWVEGPNGHSICELCGRAYSPVHDLKVAYDEVYDLRGRIERTLGYLGEIGDLTDASLYSAEAIRTIIAATIQSLTTPARVQSGATS